jgi:hypothetical protein
MARPVGSSSKNTKFLNNRLKAMFGDDFEPMINAAKSAIRMQEIANNSRDTEEEFSNHKECVAAWEKIGQYVSPKLKSIEVVDEDGNNALPKMITINVVDPRNIDS